MTMIFNKKKIIYTLYLYLRIIYMLVCVTVSDSSSICFLNIYESNTMSHLR